MSFADAKDVAEELLLTQHQAWRPDNVEVTEKYISFDTGMVRRPNRLWGGEYPPLRKNSRRAYYTQITGIQLMSWMRRFRTWYVVTLLGDLSIQDRHVLHTRDIHKAERLYDALSSLIAASRVPN